MHPNWKCLATVPHNYKIFVRESDKKSPEGSQTKTQSINAINIRNKLTAEAVKNTYESLLAETYENPVLKRKKLKITCKAQEQNTCNKFDTNNFMKFASNNDLKSFNNMLNKYPEKIDTVDQFGWTALMCAAQSGSKDIAETLLKNGANCFITDKSGNSALSLAMINNKSDIVNAIICKSPSKLPKDSKDNLEEFFCKPCNEHFKYSTRESHETSTLHLFNTKTPSSRTYFGIPVSNRGYQLLMRNGWNQNTGLGPQEDGMKFPIKTVIRKRRTGLGVEQPPARVTHTLLEKDNTNLNSKSHIQHYYNDKQKEIMYRSMLS